MSNSDSRELLLLDGILDSMEDLGYNGHLLEDGKLRSAVEGGVASQDYTALIVDLCSELKSALDLQESVALPQGSEDAESFQMELRGMLLELKCPHPNLTGLNLLSSYSQRLLVLDYLVSEVMTCRMIGVQQEKEREEGMEVDRGQADSIPANLAAILQAYGINRPPSTVTVKQLYDRIIGKTQDLLRESPQVLGPGLVTQALSEEQWATLDHINKTLTQEYAVRRQMLLTRCDVTIQSFGWSERVKGSRQDQVTNVYQEKRDKLSVMAPISLARVLAAKGDLLSIRKTNDQSVRSHTQCAINKILIGKVPDRGGRPRETRPPPEMPAFKKRTEAPREQRQRGGGAGGKGRGGRVQGGWSGGKGAGKGGWGRQGSHGNSYYGNQGGKNKEFFS